MVVARYLLHVGTKVIEAGVDQLRSEHWLGVEIASPLPIDLEQFSIAIGYDLIPAERMSADELRSVGVERFEPIVLDGRHGAA